MMMKKSFLIFFLVVSSLMASPKMKMFQTVSKDEATILQTGQDRAYCPNCGMSLVKFWKTSHAIKFKDGTYRQFCSIYCLAEQLELTELRGKEDTISQYMVVDVPSLKYIDAKRAYYVVGSKKKGTMTTTSKYAFKYKSDAKKFSDKFGGHITDFDGAYSVALSDFAKDTGLVLAKRSTKMYKMGKKIYNNRCDKSKLESFDAHTMGSMKAMIRDSRACGDLNNKQLQGVMLYYWDVKLKNFEKLYGENKEIKQHAKKFQKKFESQNR
jgi:nitrous oxide reductase accessory protein NosL